jgi:hypothetical protein
MQAHRVGSVFLFVGLFVACGANPDFQPPPHKLNADDYKVPGSSSAAQTAGHPISGRDGGVVPSPSSGTSGNPSSSSGDTTSGGTSSGGNPNTAHDDLCAKETTNDACYTCCGKNHPKGNTAWTQASTAYGGCLCQTPGTCAQECANDFCAGKDAPSGGTCDKCMQTATKCESDYQAAVGKEPDYAAFDGCVIKADCDKKP